MSNRAKILDISKTLFSIHTQNAAASGTSTKNQLRRLSASWSVWRNTKSFENINMNLSQSHQGQCHSLDSSFSSYSAPAPRNPITTSQLPSIGGMLETQRKILGIGSSSRSIVTQIVNPTQTKMELNCPAAAVSCLADDPKLLSKEDRNEFMAVFQELVREVTESPEYRDMPETNRWLARVLQFNVPHGKRNRGLATALAYRYLTPELHEDNVKLSYVLGWTVEMLQAFFLVADDIMDGSETRRGHPCWYKIDNIGSAAFNDAILLESSIYVILKKYFREKDYYVDLLDIMHDATHKTIYGQSLDTRTGYQRQMETYTLEKYNAIVKYKTSYYSFYLPVALAMAMARINDPELIRQVKLVTLEMGHFFQVQDDYLDCFGDTEVTGKIGTDIQDCKCSWLFVTALQTATPAQRKLLLDNYGQNEQNKISTVKKLYVDMKIPELYTLYEESTYNMISSHISQMSPGLPKQLFIEMLAKIYHRSS